ncbi:PREDICTED: G-protein coupled receptor 35 [Condylura cristata]|uniref:G-protein coupled receptor 35 n=1 Tax=Condylura cristata TaxID=143302 RepID=UPI0006429865|nr:PREDICTED: G-protein coupled receptor 35 [Condylura cristata]
MLSLGPGVSVWPAQGSTRALPRPQLRLPERGLLGFYPPLAVLLFCSLQVLGALARRPAADAAQVAASRRAARVVWANLAVFVVCFLPLHLVLTARLAWDLPACPLQFALHLTNNLCNANCCLDAICYYFLAREFPQASTLRPSAEAPQATVRGPDPGPGQLQPPAGPAPGGAAWEPGGTGAAPGPRDSERSPGGPAGRDLAAPSS